MVSLHESLPNQEHLIFYTTSINDTATTEIYFLLIFFAFLIRSQSLFLIPVRVPLTSIEQFQIYISHH